MRAVYAIMKERSKKLRQAILTVLSVVFLFASTGKAEKPTTLCVQSLNIKPYNISIDGFKDAFPTKLKKIILSESDEMDLTRRIEAAKPDLILSIGQTALLAVKEIRHIPIIYLMVENPTGLVSGAPNITGINMGYPEEKKIAIIQDFIPGLKSLMLLYNPENKTAEIEKIREALKGLGISLFAKSIYSPKEVLSTLMNADESLKADIFLMIPDTTVINKLTAEAVLLYSLKNKVPVVAFSEKYLDLGAFLAITVDEYDMGKQAGKIARKIFTQKGRDPAENFYDIQMPAEYVEDAQIFINRKVVEKFDVILNPKTRQNVIYVN